LVNPWLYERCREWEADRDGRLDLWPRGHYKSTIITFGGTLQEILRNPEVTVGIFSHTRPIAKAFLKQLKTELETNALLKQVFSDILWAEPEKQAPTWSLDGGIVVHRQGNPKECTVEASGLVDGQPTSRHYSLMVYDDVVTRESVTTPDQIRTTTDAWSLSLNLASRPVRMRYIGTYYHANDTYHEMERRGAAKPRIYRATVDGSAEGLPVFLTRAENVQKRREMGPYVYACQMLLDPLADNAQGFRDEWLRYYDGPLKVQEMNLYLLVDPASEKKDSSDYTVMTVIGLGADQNYYLVDLIRDRLNLTQRTETLMGLVQKYPRLVRVGYEKYGLQADVEHIRYVQNERNFRFQIIELGGAMPKRDRIRRLVPPFEQGRFWLPRRLFYTDWERRYHDLVQDFIADEYRTFPVSAHDDMLDAIARITDPELRAVFPTTAGNADGAGALTTASSMTNSAFKVL